MATPIVLCAKSEDAAKEIKEILAPKFEIIYLISSPEKSVDELTQIFKGEAPAGAQVNIGTGNFSAAPKAVVCSNDWEKEWFNKIFGQTLERGVPILNPRDFDQMQGLPAKMVGERANVLLQKLKDEKQLEGGHSGLYGY